MIVAPGPYRRFILDRTSAEDLFDHPPLFGKRHVARVAISSNVDIRHIANIVNQPRPAIPVLDNQGAVRSQQFARRFQQASSHGIRHMMEHIVDGDEIKAAIVSWKQVFGQNTMKFHLIRSACILAPHMANVINAKISRFWKSGGQTLGQRTLIAADLKNIRRRTPVGYALRATFFEQVFDFILLLSAGFAGLAALTLGLNSSVSILLLVLLVPAAILFMRPIASAGAGLLGWAAKQLPFVAGHLENARSGFMRAAETPPRISLQLSLWSFMRLLVLAGRVALIALVLVPGADLWLVALGSPLAGLVAALPLTPGGLGFTEWSWTAMLIVAGASASQAAVAALGFRIITMVALALLMVAIIFLRLLRRG